MPGQKQLDGLDVERVRFSRERELADQLLEVPGFTLHRRSMVPRDSEGIRRRLLARSLRLTETMAPQAFEQAETARRVLGNFEGELELYQSTGRENAALHLVERPILLEIQGRLLSLLDPDAGIALFGHELGHYLAHGPWTELGAIAFTGQVLAEDGLLSSRDAEIAMRLVLAREITADRFGLLASQDLAAALRLEMIAVTGLSGDALTWDTDAYLAQSRELMEQTLSRGQRAHASTHPEHSLRAWALWLFSETDVYRELCGKGSGRRPLSEVDELIAKALGAPGLDLQFDARDEPPAFLWECALACAVLVATADGELQQEELDAIEDAFSRAVPGWSELLDPEIALESFYETGAMVRAAGPDLARSLVLLQIHIMGAGGVVDGRELEMLLSIGEALGLLPQFRLWLRSSLAAMAVELEIETVKPSPLPLPVRAREVKDALDALCDSVTRRGQMLVSPRRLLRLVGKPDATPDALADVAELLVARGIEIDPALDEGDLDERVRLVATRGHRQEAPPTIELDASRRAFIAAVTRLRDELVSGDGRSPSVRLRSIRSKRAFDLTRLDQVRPGTAERVLQLVIAGRKSPLVTAQDAGRHDTAEACSNELRDLHRAMIDRQEETGAHDLYLGHPFVVGNVAPRGSSQGGYGIRAPLVLYPVDLLRDGRGKRGFSLSTRGDEDPIINQSLIQILFNKASLALPDALSRELDEIAGDREQGIEQLLAKLAEVGLHITAESTTLASFRNRDRDLDESPPFLAIEECALIGLFPQSSSDILQDYDTLLRDLADPQRELSELLAAGAALLLTDGQPDPAGDGDAEHGWPVVPADPSQRHAMAACRRHLVTVVDGPPGTGKSQLIVNLVADALRRGERVAVVAEKRAALDVVHQRLHGRGLADGVAVVHDVHDDRKPLYASLARRLEAEPAKGKPNPKLARAHKEYRRLEDLLARETKLLGREQGRSGLKIGQLLTLAATGERVFEDRGLEAMDIEALRRLMELLDRLHPHRELWAPDCWWRARGPRGSFAGLDDDGLRSLEASMRRASALAGRFEALVAEAPVGGDELTRAAAAIRALAEARDTYRSPEGTRLLSALVNNGDSGASDLRKTWSQHSTALARWTEPTGMVVEDEFAGQVSVLSSYAGRFSRFFSLIWWRARAFVRKSLVQLWPEQAGTPFDASFLGELRDRIDASRIWSELDSVFASLGLQELAPTNTSAAELAVARLATLAEAKATMTSEAAVLLAVGLAMPRAAGDVEEFDALLMRRADQSDALAQLRAHTSDLENDFSWVASEDSAALASLAADLRRDGSRLREIDAWFAMADGITNCARSAFDSLCVAAPDATLPEWREALARAWAWAHYGRASEEDARVAQLGTATFDQEVVRTAETLRRVETELRELEVESIAARVADAELLQIPQAAYRARRTSKQRTREAILKQSKKKRSLWPLRRFVREFADEGLLDALPCWLLSPETMAVLFPREPLFDLIIFDEASQCTVEAGLPVLLRARRAVIAGDEKQMPPTSFFKTSTLATEEEDRSEDERRARDLLSGESLLSLARTRCYHVGLAWHYRCLDESLIAFSNHAMYDGELRTIPSTKGAGASPLRWIHVEDGQYDKRMNRPEAERVVDLIAELLARQPRPTVGVVAFNLPQRRTILDAIDSRVDADEDFAELWTAANMVDARDQRPFVKNLESVQGDERDIIIFSLGHAPVERRGGARAGELYVPARFGPLGRAGGERRLNVAVSRAKSEQYVVASFPPSLLHVGNARHDGPRLFRAYLEFVHELSQGRPVRAERVLDDLRGVRREHARAGERPMVDGYVPLAAQIALALEGEALRVELNLGTSDFRVPLAVGRPGEAGFCLAVVTDDGTDGCTAFERHVHRPGVLGLRGWDVMRVTAATWARRRADVIKEICRRVSCAA